MICVNIFVFLLLVNGILCHSKTKRMHMRCIKYVKLQCADGKKKTMALPQATRCKCRPC